METIRKAALAPLDPSSADRQIAAEATAKELQAMQQLAAQQRDQTRKILSQAGASEQTPPGASSSAPAGAQSAGTPLPATSPGAPAPASATLNAGNNQQPMIKAYQTIQALG